MILLGEEHWGQHCQLVELMTLLIANDQFNIRNLFFEMNSPEFTYFQQHHKHECWGDKWLPCRDVYRVAMENGISVLPIDLGKTESNRPNNRAADRSAEGVAY